MLLFTVYRRLEIVIYRLTSVTCLWFSIERSLLGNFFCLGMYSKLLVLCHIGGFCICFPLPGMFKTVAHEPLASQGAGNAA